MRCGRVAMRALALHKKLPQGGRAAHTHAHPHALLIRHIARSNEVVLQHGVDKPPIGDACLPLHKWLIEVVKHGAGRRHAHKQRSVM